MQSLKSAVRTVIAAWRAATPRHFVCTFLFALAWSAVIVVSATGYGSGRFLVTPSMNAVMSMQFNGFAVLLAVLVADHVASPPTLRGWPYVVAVPVGVAVGTTLFWLISQRVFGISGAYYHGNGHEPFAPFAWRHGTHALAVCGLATCVYVSARRARQRLEVLRGLQIDRMEAEKRLVESTLAATRARLDPALVQDALARIDALYESRPAEADAALGDLIASLRDAVPRTDDVT